MDTFTVALIQHASPVGNTGENLETAVSWARKAKEAGAQLILFPELNITGHAGHQEMIRYAEEIPSGISCKRLIDLAAELDVYISAGIAENDRGIYYNTMFVVGPQGYIGKQRKIHLSRDEYYFFRGGMELPVFDLPFVRMGIIICYDNQFPELSRCLAVKGAELIFCPHAARFDVIYSDEQDRKRAVREQKAQWELIHSCRAYDNGCFVAVCNTAGNSAETLEGVKANHVGGCMVFDPHGTLIGESQSEDVMDEMVIVSLNAALYTERREEWCFNLRTRRPEVFSILSEPIG